MTSLFTRAPLPRAVKAAALALVALALNGGAAQASWWNSDWSNRVKIDADAGPKGANIGEAIGRTQILIRLTQGNFKFDSAKQDGSDVRFVAADDKTPLHYHIEKWDGLVDQVALIWVDVPDLAPGTTTPILMYWGNEKAADGADAHATYDPDQLLVWHFGGDSALPHDSTGYGNNALTPEMRDEAGIIGFGAKFLAATPPIKLAPSASLNITAGETYTWQIWEKASPVNQTSVIYDQHDGSTPADFQVGFAAGVPYALATPATGTPVRAQAGAAISGDGWHLLTVTATADKISLYVDGSKVGEAAGGLPAINGPGQRGGASAAAAVPPTPAPAVTPAAPTTQATQAAPAVPAPSANFTGELDELEISKTVRPDGAIQVAVHSQGPNANLLSFEAPEQTSGFSTGYIGILLHSITPDAEVVIGILMIMMIISWLVMINRGMVVAQTRGANKRFRRALHDRMKANDALMPDLAKAQRKGLTGSSLLAIYEIGWREVNERLHGGRTLPDGTIAPQSLAAIRSAMDAQMVREIERLNNMMVLLTIAIAGGPFIGLLGTVVGVMITFAAIAAAGDVNVNAIAPGIAAALLATVAGLAVAIPSLFGYNYFQVRIKGVISEMTVFVDEIITRLGEGDLALDKRQSLAE
jgi:biopolymer transport protein ExbB